MTMCAALGELAVSYQPLARSVAAQYAHILPRDDLEGEAMIALCEAAQNWDGIRAFSSFAKVCIAYHLLDYIRSRLGKQNQRYAIVSAWSIDAMAEAVEGDIDELEFAASCYSLEDDVVRRSTVNALRFALGALDDCERQVIGMVYTQGMYMRHASKILGVSEISVSQLHARALKKLKSAMAGQGIKRLPDELLV